jgi:hypothetical protein
MGEPIPVGISIYCKVCRGERDELKHLSNRRKGNQTRLR